MKRSVISLTLQLILSILVGKSLEVQADQYASGALFRVTPSGEVSTIADGAPFEGLTCLAINESGSFIVDDDGEEQVLYTVSINGEIGTISIPFIPGYEKVHSIEIDAEGNYILTSNDYIYKVSPNGSYEQIINTQDIINSIGIMPYIGSFRDLTIDSSGNYICSMDYVKTNPHAPPPSAYWYLISISPQGELTVLYYDSYESDPLLWLYGSAIASTPDGRTYVAGASILFSIVNGSKTTFYGGGPLENITSIATDDSGNIIVTDSGYNRATGAIYRIAPDGTLVNIASGSPLVSPTDVAIDSNGNYIVTDLLAGPSLYMKIEKDSYYMGEYLYMEVVVQPIAQAFDAWGIIESPSGAIYSFVLNRPSPWLSPLPFDPTLRRCLRKGATPLIEGVRELDTSYKKDLLNGNIPSEAETGTYLMTIGLVPVGVQPTGIESAIPGYVDVKAIEVLP